MVLNVYYWRCPKCGKLIAGLSREQVLSNMVSHMRRHGVEVKLNADEAGIKVKEVELDV